MTWLIALIIQHQVAIAAVGVTFGAISAAENAAVNAVTLVDKVKESKQKESDE